MSSRRTLPAFAAARQGLPGSSTDLSPRAVPNHPGRSAGCLCLLLRHRSVWLHLSRQAGHLRIPIEAESGSLALRLTGSPPDSPAPLPKPTLVRLHVEQAIYMVNSFQFTRSARLLLASDRKGALVGSTFSYLSMRTRCIPTRMSMRHVGNVRYFLSRSSNRPKLPTTYFTTPGSGR
jgi:hypothetical protein